MSEEEIERHRRLNQYHAVRYLNVSGVKLDLAQFHLAEFERLEDELTPAAFNQFSNAPFVPAQANADGTLLQTAAAFDAFACAVAYHGELDEADSASFDGRSWRDRLAEAAGEDLAEKIGAIRDGSDYRGLLVYRHLAAHRGLMGERIVGRQREEGGHEVVLMLGDPLPWNTPDAPRSRIRPILQRYAVWGRSAIRELWGQAVAEWGLKDDRNLIRPAE